MNKTKRMTINNEISNLLNVHLDKLSMFGVDATINGDFKLEQVTDKITYLSTMSQINPADVEQSDIQCAAQSLHFVEYFLQSTNSYGALLDIATELGQVYKQIRHWYDLAIQNWALPVSQVWSLIDPVQPDTLNDLGGNQFEAFWANPVPMMDVQILMRTPDIEINKGPYSYTKGSAAGIAVTFTVYDVYRDSE